MIIPCPSVVCRRGLGSGGGQLYRSTSGQVLVSAEERQFADSNCLERIDLFGGHGADQWHIRFNVDGMRSRSNFQRKRVPHLLPGARFKSGRLPPLEPLRLGPDCKKADRQETENSLSRSVRGLLARRTRLFVNQRHFSRRNYCAGPIRHRRIERSRRSVIPSTAIHQVERQRIARLRARSCRRRLHVRSPLGCS